jgi:4-amino-4-deoxy-L-arabinose transferase-like glycosyltransferase
MRQPAKLAELFTGLTRPSPSRRAVQATLVAWTFVWTLYLIVTSWPGGLHPDMSEAFAWSLHPDWSYAKHPPVEAWTTGLWFLVFPRADWAFHLLAVTNIALTIWVFWLIAERYLPSDRRVVAVALQTLVFLVTFHAFRYNANSAQMPWWALATMFFLGSFETREIAIAAAAGVAGALAILTKYYALFLIAGFALAALSHPDRWKYFKSRAPWVSASVGLACLAPHFYWLFTHDPTPIDYAVAANHLPRSQAALAGIVCLVSCFLFALFALIVFIVTVQPAKADALEIVRPSDAGRRLRLVAFAAPFLLSLVVLVALGKGPTDVWNIPAWSLFGVVLLGPPQLIVSQGARVRVVSVMLLFPIVALAVSPIAAYINDQYGNDRDAGFVEQLAPAVEKEWHKTNMSPLAYVEGSAENGIAFYASDHPLPRGATQPTDMDRRGVAMVCLAEDLACVQKLDDAIADRPDGHRTMVRVGFRFLGAERMSPNFVLGIIPPRTTVPVGSR